jgi:hypothetical protein
MTKRLSGWLRKVHIDREEAVGRVRRALYGDDCIPELTLHQQDLADLPWDEASRTIGIESWEKLRARRDQIQRQIERTEDVVADWPIGSFIVGSVDRQSFEEAFEDYFPSLARSVSTTPPVVEAAQRPTYAEPESYSGANMPDQFKAWAQQQHNQGIIITAKAAEDAMRGPKDANGRRVGGLLIAGPGLSRATVRAWVDTLDPTWVASRGVPPKRAPSS